LSLGSLVILVGLGVKEALVEWESLYYVFFVKTPKAMFTIILDSSCSINRILNFIVPCGFKVTSAF